MRVFFKINHLLEMACKFFTQPINDYAMFHVKQLIVLNINILS